MKAYQYACEKMRAKENGARVVYHTSTAESVVCCVRSPIRKSLHLPCLIRYSAAANIRVRVIRVFRAIGIKDCCYGGNQSIAEMDQKARGHYIYFQGAGDII